MLLRHYFPLSVGIFVLVVSAAHYFSVPIAPFAVLLLAGVTLLGFQLEDHKAARFLGDLLRTLKSPTH